MEFPIPHIKFTFKWQVNKKSIIIIFLSKNESENYEQFVSEATSVFLVSFLYRN